MRILNIALLFVSAAVLTQAETLSFATLKANETIVIGYYSTGCFRMIARKYVISGGKPPRLEVFELVPPHKLPMETTKGPETFAGVGVLSRRDLSGLDAYVAYLRVVTSGGCTTVDRIGLGYYRNGQQVGEEQFVDETCATSSFQLDEKGGVVFSGYDENWIPKEMDPVAFKAIVLPRLIEQRIALAKAATKT